MEQVTLTNYAASFIAELRDKNNYVAQLEDIGQAIGQVIYAMDNWKGCLKPDFVKILVALENYRDMTQSMADTNYDGK